MILYLGIKFVGMESVICVFGFWV